MNIEFGTIERWPGKVTPKHQRKSSRFRAGLEDTRKKLMEELAKIGARSIVLQTYFHPMQFSQRTGWPYADAEPKDDGVILSFETTKQGPLSFPCDTYDTFDDNVRAIALSLEALRAVDRYGVTRNAEQYTGWKKLAAPQPIHIFSTADEAEAFIKEHGPTYREAARKLHPDNQETGSQDNTQWLRLLPCPCRTCESDGSLFVRLQAAMAMLEARP